MTETKISMEEGNCGDLPTLLGQVIETVNEIEYIKRMEVLDIKIFYNDEWSIWVARVYYKEKS